MRTESFRNGLISILLVSAIVLSMTLWMSFAAPPVLAGGVVEEPGGTTIEVVPGQEFALQFKLYWDDPAYLGYFVFGFYWDSPRTDSSGTENENFTFVSASAYLEDNLDNIPVNVTLSEGVSPENENMWRIAIVVGHTAGYPHDDNFYVDVVMRAAGAGGVPHIAPDNHIIKISGTVDVFESGINSHSPGDPNVTISVVPWLGGIIVQGKTNMYNIDQGGLPPYNDYTAGDTPPLMVGQRVDSGAFVAGGIASTTRNGRWNDTSPLNPNPHLDNLLDAAFQWMVPGATDVLWWDTPDVYNDTGQCSQLVTALEALGYTVDGDDRPLENLYAENVLENYDIFVINQLQRDYGDRHVGGNPDKLEAIEVAIIESFVRGGGGLLLTDGSDFGGNNYARVANKILAPLQASGWAFQHDQATDDVDNWYGNYSPVADVLTANPVGAAYEQSTGTDDIGLYSASTLTALPLSFGVDVTAGPAVVSQPEDTLVTFNVTVTNLGDGETFDLTVSDDLGWNPLISDDYTNLSVGESDATITATVFIPENTPYCTYNTVYVTATSITDNTVSDTGTAQAHSIWLPCCYFSGSADFSLVDLYTVNVEENLDLYAGSKLVVKFYAYDNVTFENENVIENFTPPLHVEENESARHPENIAVKKARLDLTTDNTEDVLATIATFTVTRDVLAGRLVDIYVDEWPFASPPERDALYSEIVDIYMQWPYAPY